MFHQMEVEDMYWIIGVVFVIVVAIVMATSIKRFKDGSGGAHGGSAQGSSGKGRVD